MRVIYGIPGEWSRFRKAKRSAEPQPARDLALAPPTAGVFAPAMRMQRVATVLLRHGFGEILERRRPAVGSRLGARVARVLADLGPTFIKLGQLLATREDLFPPEVTQALAQLHAGVPPMKTRVVERQLKAALGDEFERSFSSLDPEPLAAASIGQVHRARLRSGESVVVKVQRPGLQRTVAADLALMRWGANLLSQAVPELAAMEPLALLDAFERSITGELDFRREADNAARLAALLDGAPEVRLPGIYRALTRPTVLVMEEVHGRRLGALDEPEQKRVRARLLRAFSRQILDHGVFHADPHPGNVLVEASGRLVLLDLGAVEHVDDRLRATIGRLVLAAALGRTRALADAVLALAPDGAPRTLDRPRFETEIAQLVRDAAGAADGSKVLGQMVAVGRTHKLRLNPALLTLVRAMAILDGVLRGLDPARNLISDLRKEWMLSFARGIGRWWHRRLESVTTRLRRWRVLRSPAVWLLPWLMQLGPPLLLPAPPPAPPASSSPPPSISPSSSSSRS
jgi:ubiquinone biosynthesis protein